MSRLTKDFYYLGIAESVSKRSTCLSKNYGAVIVKNDVVVSTGYNGAPRGRANCFEMGQCHRLKSNVPRGRGYGDLCRSVHGEMNAIISASREQMLGATLYLYGFDVVENKTVVNPNCCSMCKRLIINAGISTVVIADPDVGVPSPFADYRAKIVHVSDWILKDDSLENLSPDAKGY